MSVDTVLPDADLETVDIGTRTKLTQADAPGYDDILTKTEAPGYDDILTKTLAPGYDDILTETAAPGFADILTNDIAEAAYIGVLRATVAYTDTSAKDLFDLPVGAVILGFFMNVSANFDSDGTDVVDLGITGTLEKYYSDFDVSSAGMTLIASLDEAAQAAVTVTGIYVEGGSAASQGALTVVCLYYVP